MQAHITRMVKMSYLCNSFSKVSNLGCCHLNSYLCKFSGNLFILCQLYCLKRPNAMLSSSSTWVVLCSKPMLGVLDSVIQCSKLLVLELKQLPVLWNQIHFKLCQQINKENTYFAECKNLEVSMRDKDFVFVEITILRITWKRNYVDKIWGEFCQCK